MNIRDPLNKRCRAKINRGLKEVRRILFLPGDEKVLSRFKAITIGFLIAHTAIALPLMNTIHEKAVLNWHIQLILGFAVSFELVLISLVILQHLGKATRYYHIILFELFLPFGILFFGGYYISLTYFYLSLFISDSSLVNGTVALLFAILFISFIVLLLAQCRPIYLEIKSYFLTGAEKEK